MPQIASVATRLLLDNLQIGLGKISQNNIKILLRGNCFINLRSGKVFMSGASEC